MRTPISTAYSPYQFALFRISFGPYLVQHFLLLFPCAAEVFSNQGMLPDPTLITTWGLLPNVFGIVGSGRGAEIILGVLTFLACLFTLGVFRRGSSLLLWYGWACLLGRNIFISNPGIPYVGWLLLACALIPAGEPL